MLAAEAMPPVPPLPATLAEKLAVPPSDPPKLLPPLPPEPPIDCARRPIDCKPRVRIAAEFVI